MAELLGYWVSALFITDFTSYYGKCPQRLGHCGPSLSCGSMDMFARFFPSPSIPAHFPVVLTSPFMVEALLVCL